jgi:hypothetical protein
MKIGEIVKERIFELNKRALNGKYPGIPFSPN